MKTIRRLLFSFLLIAASVFAVWHFKGKIRKEETEGEHPVPEATKTEQKEPIRDSVPLETGEKETAAEVSSDAPMPVINPVTEGRVSVICAGDNLIHERIIRYANVLAGGSGDQKDFAKTGFDFKKIYEPIRPFIESADLAVIDQVSLVGSNDAPGSLSGYPLFNSPSDLGKDLQATGFDLVNLAGSHVMDLGENAVEKSLDFWDSIGMRHIGAYRNEEEFRSPENKIIELNGVKIACLAFTETTNGLYSASNGIYIPYSVSQSKKEKGEILKEFLTQQVRFYKERSDCVLVWMYWGTNSGFEAGTEEEKCARILSEAGADVIIGTGAKVIQKTEWIETDGRKTLCAYSLGNTLCTMEYMENLLGGLFSFDVCKNENGVTIENVLFLPTVIHYDEKGSGIAVYPLALYSEELFSRHGSNLSKGFGRFEWYRETVRRYIPKEFLPANIR